MKILGIETSCDETAISLIEIDKESNKITVLGNKVHSQINEHVPYGGVFPMLAKREHAKNLVPVLESVLKESNMFAQIESTDNKITDLSKFLEREPELLANLTDFLNKKFDSATATKSTTKKPDIDYISVTYGPGLEPALWVGVLFARALSHAWEIPIVPCNHMEGHILTGLIQKLHGVSGEKTAQTSYDLLDKRIMYPALSLLISGGHTQIILIEKIGKYKIIGDTRDDAVGECFDKVARTLGLEYPGGPKISALAETARNQNIKSPIALPRPMLNSDDLDFSFSGLKTAVLYAVKDARGETDQNKTAKNDITLSDDFIKGICRETEDAITDVLIHKTRTAIEKYAIETLIIGGGVIANKNIRQAMEKLVTECTIKILVPETDHSTDNGLMIALAGYFNTDKAVDANTEIKAKGTLPLGPRG